MIPLPRFVMYRILPLLLAMPLAGAIADSVKLKSGEIVEGTIIQNDAGGVTIEIQFSPTITDQRHIPRADIAAAAVVSEDEVAFAKIRDLPTPATALDARPYDELLQKQLRPFLKEFPTSARVPDVKLRIKALEADLARIKKGDVKVAGIWYDAAAYREEKYQIDAAILLAAMQRNLAARNYPAAANSFDQLQRSFPSSAAYAEAVPLAAKFLPKFSEQLAIVLANLPQTRAQRQAVIDRTPVEQRPPIQQAIAAEDARAEAVAAAAQRASVRFFPILPYDEKGLKSMQLAAQQLADPLKLVDRKKLERGAKLAHQANDELSRHELAALETTLASLQATWGEYEGLPRLKQRLESAKQDDAASSVRAAEKAARSPKPTAAKP